jgi:LysM repeat protein
VGAAATKCLVCGADLTVKTPTEASGAARVAALNAPRARVPVRPILALLVLVALAGGAYYGYTRYFANNTPGPITAANVTNTPSPTNSPLPTFTWTPTPTESPVPTDTPQPPIDYKVVAGDTCVAIAAAHNVSSQSIIVLNHLDPNCNLSVGRSLLIPLPTPTSTPLPSATLGAAVVTQVQRETYTIHLGDTLAGIAKHYGIPLADLMSVNGISDPNSITAGQVLIIPLELVVTPGPSPTPTSPPPWPAPNQLLPADGQTFNASDVVTLQWTAVGTLRPNEYYVVNIEDVTCNCARVLRQATLETKLIVPGTFRHTDNSLHVYRWTVTTGLLRAGDTTLPQYDSAGASSPIRDFVWMGGSITPTP